MALHDGAIDRPNSMVMTDNCPATISTTTEEDNNNVFDGGYEQNGCGNTGSPSPPPVAAGAAESTPIVVDEDEPEVDVEDTPFDSRIIPRPDNDRRFDEEFETFDVLGRGRFGEVRRCRERSTNREFAAKLIATPKPKDRQDALHEVEIMCRLRNCRRLVQLYDVFESRNDVCLVLEIIYGGELFERAVSDDFILTEKACVCIVRQICEGIAFMHSKNIIHLDMKPENILCLSRSSNRIKIIDFGLAREYVPGVDTRVMYGTPEFMAPEVVHYDPVDFATDMWSLGVICYVLLSGLSPFMGDNDPDTMTNVVNGRYDFHSPEFDSISDDAKDMIISLLQQDKRKRPTAETCLSHRWLQKTSPPMTKISKERLKQYVSGRKWQKAINVMIALRRMGVNLTPIDGQTIIGETITSSTAPVVMTPPQRPPRKVKPPVAAAAAVVENGNIGRHPPSSPSSPPVVAPAVERRDLLASGKKMANETDAVGNKLRPLRIRQPGKESGSGIDNDMTSSFPLSTADENGRKTTLSPRLAPRSEKGVKENGSTSPVTPPAQKTASGRTVITSSPPLNGQLPTVTVLAESRLRECTAGKVNGSKSQRTDAAVTEPQLLTVQSNATGPDDVTSTGSTTSMTRTTDASPVGNAPVKRSSSKLSSSGLGRRLNFFVRDRVIFFTQKDSRPTTEAGTSGSIDANLRQQRSTKSKSPNHSR